MEPVVVTGLGAITPLGLTVEDTWQALLAGRCGITRSRYVTDQDMPSLLSGDIHPGYDPRAHFPSKRSAKLDPHAQYALVAGRAALADARLDPRAIPPSRGAVLTGIGVFGVRTVADIFQGYGAMGHLGLRPNQIGNALSSTAAGMLCIETGFMGLSMNVQTACASSTSAVILGVRLLQSGAFDAVIVASGEAPVHNVVQAAWCALAAMSIARNDDPEGAVRPFDEDRDGLIMSELGAALILETERHAIARGRKPYARILGWGESNDAHHPYAPKSEGQQLALQQALTQADLSPSDVGYVNAHGTGTFLGDQVEAETLTTIFGAGRAGPVIGATKSMTGHAMGATGALEMAILALALRDGIVPPNKNQPKPIADLNWSPGRALPLPSLRRAMSLTFGVGGNNAAVIFETVD